MQSKTNLYLILAAAVLLALPSAGCGDSTECGPGTVQKGEQCVADQTIGEQPGDELECGAGTVEQDGACVPDGAETACGPKTTLQDGQCVIAADACQAGENLDPNSGECVAAGGPECGQGTALDSGSGECVPTADVCDSGTVFDEASGLCLPDACQVGDVLLGGICVSPAQELAAQADVEEVENNDPAHGGQTNALTLKSIGERTVFTGKIDAPSDLSGDGEVDQDLDIFHFEAVAGQLLQLSVQSTGIPSPAFLVEGPNGFQRLSPQLGGADTARQILIPVDGTYTVTVMPAAYAAAIVSGSSVAGPYGGDDWGYVGTIEEIDAPTPVDVDANGGSLSGEYSTLGDNFFNLTGLSAGDDVTLQVETSQPSARGVLQIWADGAYIGSHQIAQGDTLQLLAPASGELQVVADWLTVEGLATAFEISAAVSSDTQGLGSIGADDAISSAPVDVPDGESVAYTFEVEAGQLIELKFANDTAFAPTQIRLTDMSGDHLVPAPDYGYAYENVPQGRYSYAYSAHGGSYRLEIRPGNSFDLENLVTTITTSTPVDLGEVASGDTVAHTQSDQLDAWASDFYLVSNTDAVVISGEIDGEASKQIGLYFLAEDNTTLANRGFQNGTLTFHETLLAPGTTLLKVTATNQAHAGYSLELNVDPAQQLEVEPNNGPLLANPFDISSALYGSVPGSLDDDYYTFTIPADMAADEVFSLIVDPLDSASASFRCTLSDQNGDLVGVNNPHALYNGCVTMATGLQASETYFLHIEATRQHPTSPLTYKLSAATDMGMLEAEPNNAAASATSFDLSELQAGTSIYGELPSDVDVDYFSFTLAADMNSGDIITLELEQFGPYTFQYGQIELLDAGENVVTSAPFYGQLQLENLLAGDYYLKLRRNAANPAYGMVYRIDAL